MFMMLPFCALAACFCGCSKSVAVLDLKERGMAALREASGRKTSGNMDGALNLYAEALDRNPKLGTAHLDMALIFHDHKKDYLRAIYHYERYLELRPKTEKKRIIEDRIRLAGQSYAAKIAADGSALAEMRRLSDAMAELKNENDALKNTIRQLTLNLEQAKAKPSAVETKPGKAVFSVPIEDDSPARLQDVTPASRRSSASEEAYGSRAVIKKTGVQMYTVKNGDSLRSIAMELYRDAGKAEELFNANRDKLTSPDTLRVGQVLVVP